MDSSPNFRPHAEMGNAQSQSLLCWARIAVSLALSVSVDALCHTDSRSRATVGVSQARCLTAASSAGYGSEYIADQLAQAPVYSASGVDQHDDRISCYNNNNNNSNFVILDILVALRICIDAVET